jgi:hypothetical protein
MVSPTAHNRMPFRFRCIEGVPHSGKSVQRLYPGFVTKSNSDGFRHEVPIGDKSRRVPGVEPVPVRRRWCARRKDLTQNRNFSANCTWRGSRAARIWLKVGELMSLSGKRKFG